MKLLDFGSLNIDYTYAVSHITQPGETQTARSRTTFCGGKGLNQAIALSKAGSDVFLAGMIGPDGEILQKHAAANGVRTDLIRTVPAVTGHAMIQVDDNAANCITLYSGTNRLIDPAFADEVLRQFGPGDILLLQNEISALPYIMEKAAEKQMRIVLNPSPFDEHLDACDLSQVWLFLINEVEGYQMTGEKDPDAILASMLTQYPHAAVVLTLGADGARYCDGHHCFSHPAYSMNAVDTTCAGDTFTGYFLTALLEGQDIPTCLRLASMAAGISVTRPGASDSIPLREEVDRALAAPV